MYFKVTSKRQFLPFVKELYLKELLVVCLYTLHFYKIGSHYTCYSIRALKIRRRDLTQSFFFAHSAQKIDTPKSFIEQLNLD